MEAGVDLFASRETSHCPLWFLHMHPASLKKKKRTGCDGADGAEALSVCSFPNHSAPGSPGESLPGPGSTSHCPTVAGQSMVPIYTSLLDGPSLELPVGRDVLSQAGGFIFHPQPEL